MNEDQRYMIDTYVGMYNSTMRQIDLLYTNLDTIRGIIDHLVQTAYPLDITLPISTTRTQTNAPNAAVSLTEEPIQQQQQPQPIQRVPNVRLPLQSVSEINQTRFSIDMNDQIINMIQRFSNAVPVVPNATQLQNGIRHCVFNTIENPINTSCPIAREVFLPEQEVSQIIHCGHIFENEQLQRWFQSNVRCPVCRYDIREYNSIPISTSLHNENERQQNNIPPPTPTPTPQQQRPINAMEIVFESYLLNDPSNNIFDELLRHFQ